MEQKINCALVSFKSVFVGFRSTFILSACFVFFVGCGSDKSQLFIEFDPTVASQPHGDLVRTLVVEFHRFQDHGLSDSEVPARKVRLSVPSGLSSGQTLDLPMPQTWSQDRPGVWKVSGLADDNRPLLKGETQVVADQKDVSIVLRDALTDE